MNHNGTPVGPGKTAGLGRTAFALFCLVFFARAWLIKVWGSPVPYWDQWDAEALGLFRPWLDGTLHWTDLFAPHNEHRIVLTRVADLALFIVNGHWNPWWQLLLNAALHAATAATLVGLFWPMVNGLTRTIGLLGLVLLFIAPAGWQNALWGFQSQVYFCSLLSGFALGGLLLAQPFKLNWWLGWTAGLLALFSVGSGVLAAATVLLVNLFVLITALIANGSSFPPENDHEHRSIAPALFTSVVVLVLVILGRALQVEAPQHAPLHAHTLEQFRAVFFRCLSWPWVESSWLWLFLQAPLLWFTATLIRRRTPPNAIDQFALGLGLLAVLHAAAVAYSRGAGLVDARPLSRYQDPLLLGVAANLFILLKFAAQGRTARIFALFWAGIFLAGLLTLTTTNFSLHLPFKRAQNTANLSQIRSYLATHDAAVFSQDRTSSLLHPDSAVVRRVLDDSQLRQVLPAEFSDHSARPPWLIAYSPWLTPLSAFALLLIAIQCARLSGN